MKIVITAQDNSLNSEVDPRFGRCKYFALVDSTTNDVEFIENTGVNADSGAGVQSAQKVVDLQAEAVLTGRVGPKAMRGLETGKVRVYEGITGTIATVIEKFNHGQMGKEDGSE